jgi:hypothetical protein
MNRLIQQLPQAQDDDEFRQQIALCVFLAVAMFEAFMNSYALTLVRRPEYRSHAARINADLASRRPLGRKLKTWPKALFSRPFGQGDAKAKMVTAVLDLRNRLMHFTPELENLVFAGQHVPMINSEVFDSLREETAIEAANTCYAAIEWLIRCHFKNESAAREQMHLWTVTIPRP